MSVIKFADKLKEFDDADAKLVAEVLQKLKGERLEWCPSISTPATPATRAF